MKPTLIATIAAAVALSACGNDQNDVADTFIADAEEAGISLDEQCVRDLSADLTDEDVTSLEVGNTPTPAAEAVLGQMFIQCVGTDDIIEQITTALPEGVDEECVVEALKDLSPEQLQDPTAPEVVEAVAACLSAGG